MINCYFIQLIFNNFKYISCLMERVIILSYSPIKRIVVTYAKRFYK